MLAQLFGGPSTAHRADERFSGNVPHGNGNVNGNVNDNGNGTGTSSYPSSSSIVASRQPPPPSPPGRWKKSDSPRSGTLATSTVLQQQQKFHHNPTGEYVFTRGEATDVEKENSNSSPLRTHFRDEKLLDVSELGLVDLDASQIAVPADMSLGSSSQYNRQTLINKPAMSQTASLSTSIAKRQTVPETGKAGAGAGADGNAVHQPAAASRSSEHQQQEQQQQQQQQQQQRSMGIISSQKEQQQQQQQQQYEPQQMGASMANLGGLGSPLRQTVKSTMANDSVQSSQFGPSGPSRISAAAAGPQKSADILRDASFTVPKTNYSLDAGEEQHFFPGSLAASFADYSAAGPTSTARLDDHQDSARFEDFTERENDNGSSHGSSLLQSLQPATNRVTQHDGANFVPTNSADMSDTVRMLQSKLQSQTHTAASRGGQNYDGTSTTNSFSAAASFLADHEFETDTTMSGLRQLEEHLTKLDRENFALKVQLDATRQQARRLAQLATGTTSGEIDDVQRAAELASLVEESAYNSALAEQRARELDSRNQLLVSAREALEQLEAELFKIREQTTSKSSEADQETLRQIEAAKTAAIQAHQQLASEQEVHRSVRAHNDKLAQQLAEALSQANEFKSLAETAKVNPEQKAIVEQLQVRVSELCGEVANAKTTVDELTLKNKSLERTTQDLSKNEAAALEKATVAQKELDELLDRLEAVETESLKAQQRADTVQRDFIAEKEARARAEEQAAASAARVADAAAALKNVTRERTERDDLLEHIARKLLPSVEMTPAEDFGGFARSLQSKLNEQEDVVRQRISDEIAAVERRLLSTLGVTTQRLQQQAQRLSRAEDAMNELHGSAQSRDDIDRYVRELRAEHAARTAQLQAQVAEARNVGTSSARNIELIRTQAAQRVAMADAEVSQLRDELDLIRTEHERTAAERDDALEQLATLADRAETVRSLPVRQQQDDDQSYRHPQHHPRARVQQQNPHREFQDRRQRNIGGSDDDQNFADAVTVNSSRAASQSAGLHRAEYEPHGLRDEIRALEIRLTETERENRRLRQHLERYGLSVGKDSQPDRRVHQYAAECRTEERAEDRGTRTRHQAHCKAHKNIESEIIKQVEQTQRLMERTQIALKAERDRLEQAQTARLHARQHRREGR